MTEGKPHQDPIADRSTKPARTPSDGLAAALNRIDELEGKILETATVTGQGAGLILKRIDELEACGKIHQARIQDLIERIEQIEERCDQPTMAAIERRLANLEAK